MSNELARLADLRSANVARQKEWDAGNQLTLAYRGNELAGEVGEACNVIKKLERERLGIAGSRDTVAHLAEELADVVICADLIAMHEGIDLLGEAVPAKFNSTSDKVGLKTRLAASDSGVKGEPEPVAFTDAQWLKKRTSETGVVLKNGERTRFLEIVRFAERHIPAPPAEAGMREALQQAIDEASYIASIHAHHALWRGLLPYGWDAATERFGRNLAGAISKAIKAEVPKRLPALTAPGATTKSDDVRWGDSGPIPGQHFGDEFATEPSPSDPSSTRSGVTVEESVEVLSDYDRGFQAGAASWKKIIDEQAAYTAELESLLETHQIRRK